MRTRGNIQRIRKGKIIAGVCSGLGEYFDVDPVIFRIIFVILVFLDWLGVLAYILLWIVLPMKPEEGEIREINKE